MSGCGCRVEYDAQVYDSGTIVYCPLHAVAERLAEFVEDVEAIEAMTTYPVQGLLVRARVLLREIGR